MPSDLSSDSKRDGTLINQVKYLRIRGYSCPEISRALGASLYTIKSYSSLLVRSGEIPRMPSGRPSNKISNETIGSVLAELSVEGQQTAESTTSKAIASSPETEVVRKYIQTHPYRTFRGGFRSK